MRVAVTGATGFIGRHVVTRFVESGMDVRAIVRPARPPIAWDGVRVIVAPLERDALVSAFEGVDAVVHLAGVVSATNQQAYTNVNVTATAAVAEAAAAVNAHLVHVSSLAAAGPASRARPRRESDPPSPITPYGRSKLLGELAVQRVPGLRWTILRPGVVYGPGDRAMLPLFRWASRGLAPLVGRDDAAYTFLHVADMVRTVEAALDARAAGEVLFVGHPEPVTARSVLDAIEDALGRRVFVVTVPAAFVRATALVGDLVASVSRHPPVINSARARELFAEGFVCVVDRVRDRLGIVAGMDLARGMRATCVWYRSAGWL